ncbi:MAG: MauE/DoxX family redox-associated membrane protein [Terrimicrobiaceae bacterium]
MTGGVEMTPAFHPSKKAIDLTKKDVLSWVVRIVLAAVFLYAGIIKSTASEQFLVALAPFTFFPEPLLLPLSTWLPLGEILVGLLILIPKTHRLGAGLALGLLVVFMGVLGWALSQGIIVSCSCFGEDDAPSAWKMVLAILRDLFLAVAALWLIVRENLPPHAPPTTFPRNPIQP